MTSRTTILTAAALALVVTVAWTMVPSPAASPGSHVNTSAGYTLAGSPLALRGVDPVSYFTMGKPQPGEARFQTSHDGATYRFASEESMKAFQANPVRYVPQFGGFCAYGVAVGKKFDGDPSVWAIENDRLYLNLNADVAATWKDDLAGNIREARANWPGIRDTAPADL